MEKKALANSAVSSTGIGVGVGAVAIAVPSPPSSSTTTTTTTTTSSSSMSVGSFIELPWEEVVRYLRRVQAEFRLCDEAVKAVEHEELDGRDLMTLDEDQMLKILGKLGRVKRLQRALRSLSGRGGGGDGNDTLHTVRFAGNRVCRQNEVGEEDGIGIQRPAAVPKGVVRWRENKASSQKSGRQLWIWLAIPYLTAEDLAKLSLVCRKSRIACERNARKRCIRSQYGHYYNWTKLLRVSEIVKSSPKEGPAIAVPTLCSVKRIVVQGAGVADVNGIYVNCDMSVNGRVFNKMRDGKKDVYTIRKLYSGHQLFWYLSKNNKQMYWANVPFMQHSIATGYPPRQEWGAFELRYRPSPTICVFKEATGSAGDVKEKR